MTEDLTPQIIAQTAENLQRLTDIVEDLSKEFLKHLKYHRGEL